MSIRILTEVWSSPPARQGTLLVLLALADSADETSRECWPSIKTIARKSVLSERQVQHCLRELCEAEIIDVDANAGRHGTNLYRVRRPEEWGVRKLRGGEAEFGGGVKPTSPGGVKPTSPEPSYGTVSEPSESSVDFFSAENGADHGDVVAIAVSTWNEAADRNHWPRVKKTTSARKRSLRARMRDVGGIDGWRQIVARVEASDWLRKSGSTNWFSFDWLLKEANFTKLIEGNYDNRGGYTPSATPGRMNPDNPMEGIPEEEARIIRYEIDPELRDKDARAWWARREAAE